VRIRRYQEAILAERSVVFYRAWMEQVRSWSRGHWFWSRILPLLPGPLRASFDVGRTAAQVCACAISFGSNMLSPLVRSGWAKTC
jgi:hypothetical protein